MKKATIVSALAFVFLATSVAPVEAATRNINSRHSNQNIVTKKIDSTTTSWNYNGIQITVHGAKQLSITDKQKYEQTTVSQGLIPAFSFSKHANTNQSLIEPNASLPGGESGFTLFNEQNQTFNNTYTYAAIYGAISGAAAYLALPFGLGWAISGGGVTGALSAYIHDCLQVSNYAYVKLRLGTAYSSYWGYYEVVETLVRYSNSSFSTPVEVIYGHTGAKVPNETLALYGLRNP